MQELEASLGRHWESHMAPFIDSLRYDWKRAVVAPAIVSAAIFIVIALFGGAIVAGLVIALITGGIWALVIRSRYQRAEQNVSQATQVLADAKQQSLHRLRGAGAELYDWQSEFGKYDSDASRVQKVIEDFRSTQGSTAFEGRRVSV
jgi:hypothetical protein